MPSGRNSGSTAVTALIDEIARDATLALQTAGEARQ